LAKNLRLTDTVTISSSGTVSTSIQLQSNRIPVALVMPAAMSGTALTFQASADDQNYYALYNETAAYSIGINPLTSKYIALNTQVMEGVKYLKIVSSASETATRTIGVINGE
jgi:hypothetical protein